MRDSRRLASAWVASLIGHLGLVGAGALLVANSLSARPASVAWARTSPRPEDAIEIELPTMVFDSIAVSEGPAAVLSTPIARGGGEGTPRPDMDAQGRGGTDTSAQPALNLSDRDDATLLSPDVRSRFDRSQIQRVRSGRARASREDWRASREPMELTFLASGGDGARHERRDPSAFDPSAGAVSALAAGRVGGALGAADMPFGIGENPRQPGGTVEGGARASPGIGVRDGAPGEDHRASADVATGRPLVAQGTPSVPANTQGRPQDTLDSEQEVATAMQSIIHASTAGGALGPGPGGQAGVGPTGSGGVSGPGSSARSLGTGAGGYLDNDPRDRRRTDYQRKARSRIDRLWAFPKWAALEGMQGTVIVTFVINADGSVSNATVTRPSGIADFDESCRQAVLRAGPYGPLPPELGSSFRWALPFEARNPAVRPKDVAAVP